MFKVFNFDDTDWIVAKDKESAIQFWLNELGFDGTYIEEEGVKVSEEAKESLKNKSFYQDTDKPDGELKNFTWYDSAKQMADSDNLPQWLTSTEW